MPPFVAALSTLFAVCLLATSSVLRADDGPVEAPPGLQVGQTIAAEATELTFLDTAGESYRLADMHGEGGSLVIFLSNTCPYVLDWLDRLPRLANAAQRADIGLAVVNSNARKRRASDSVEEMSRLWNDRVWPVEMRRDVDPADPADPAEPGRAEALQAAVPYLVDEESKLADQLGAQRTPEVFLFDPLWRLVYRGAIDDLSGPFEEVTTHYLLDAVDSLLSGVAPPLASTPALGCAIQRPRAGRRKSIE